MFVGLMTSTLMSSLIPKIVVLIPSLLIFLSLHRLNAETKAIYFFYLILIIIAKDLSVVLFNVPELLVITEIVYACAVVCFLVSFFEKKNVAIVFVIITNLISIILFFILFESFPVLLSTISGFVIFFDIAFFAFEAFVNRDKADNIAQLIIVKTWIPITLLFIAYTVFTMLFGFGSDIMSRLIMPISYIWLVIVGLFGFKLNNDELLSAVSYYEESTDSLYNLFLRIGSVLKGTFSIESVLASFNEAIIAETGASSGAIYIIDELEDMVITKAYSGFFPPPFALPESLPKKQNRIEAYMKHAQFALGENLLGEIAKTGHNIFVANAETDNRLSLNGDDDFLHISSFIALPLMVGEKIIGVSAIAKTQPNDFFTESDYDRYKMLVNFGTLAVNNFFSFLEVKERTGIEQTADIAADIQGLIVPKKLPQFPSLSMGVFSIPAKGVSGDYYDAIRTREDRLITIIGDVAGKGVQAVLIMVMIRALLHLVTNTNKDIATVLDWVNKGIAGKINVDHYATLGILAINLTTGELEYANAAHQPLLIYRRASNMVETIEIKSVPIGIEKTTRYTRKVLRLQQGDIAILYTDGIVEAMNEQGKQFGRNNLGQCIVKYKDASSKEIADKVKSELTAFIGSARQHDDQTVLILKMN